ncbi:nucleotide sugar dehydrogenase [Streptomyces sp. NPDC057249]|uniref:nucleotide sugar dehydrogenase n=1 Tax=Streptomyces sp. NPDC057249 TaxID=3346067 RepID=UPI00363C6095
MRKPSTVQAGRVAVVGLGYVGLPTALALHASGTRVTGMDVSPARLDAVRRRAVDLLPGQCAGLAAALDDEEFLLTDDADAFRDCEAVVICVPTPVTDEAVPDLTELRAACAAVVARAQAGQLLLLTSTSYVGTTRDLLVTPPRERGLRPERDVFVAFAPERIDPGNPLHDQERTPRMVGGVGSAATERAAELLARTAPVVHRVDSPETAEKAKLWENTFRAVNIALANELADGCLTLGLNPRAVIEAAATKPYGFMPFYPGPGVGGHCIPCDPHYLRWQLTRTGAATPLLDTAMAAVAARPDTVASRALALLAARKDASRPPRVLLLGVSYKPGVADVRDSPALRIIDALSANGASVAYTDPYVPTLARGPRVLTAVADPATRHWDLVIVHTRHPGWDVSWVPDSTPVLDPTHNAP